MAPSKIESMCPSCYFKLPNPEDFLAPGDTELNYVMWMPGFEWTPLPVFEEEVLPGEEEEQLQEPDITDADLKEALAEMVEQDEMTRKFKEIAGSDGYTTPEKAAALARQLGLAPSGADVEAMKQEHGSRINYATFQSFCAVCTHPEDKVDDMLSALALFDPSSSGIITAKQLRNILTTLGETLTQDEVNAALKKLMPGKDSDQSKAFCERLLER